MVAHEVDSICPDETALHIPAPPARWRAPTASSRGFGDDELAFVPDSLMDEPEQTKQGLREAYRGLLELDFDLLLLAHGDPDRRRRQRRVCAGSWNRRRSAEGPGRLATVCR